MGNNNNGWIKVSDRLPDYGRDVFILLKNDKGEVAYEVGIFLHEWLLVNEDEDFTPFNTGNDKGYKIVGWIYPPKE